MLDKGQSRCWWSRIELVDGNGNGRVDLGLKRNTRFFSTTTSCWNQREHNYVIVELMLDGKGTRYS
eukprot:1169155-Amorphochlora_amoeboformis.AAC.1